MARGVNKVILVGNLGQDPETRAMPSGKPVTNVRIATSDAFRLGRDPLVTVRGVAVRVGGKHDGLIGDQIVEIKTRQRRLLGTPTY